jgi:hypothetical protein
MWAIGVQRRKSWQRRPTWHVVGAEGRAACDRAVQLLLLDIKEAPPPVSEESWTCTRCWRPRSGVVVPGGKG